MQAKTKKGAIISFFILSIAALAALGYFAYTLYTQVTSLTATRQNLESELSQTQQGLLQAQEQISLLTSELEETVEELEETEDDLRDEQDRNEQFSEQIEDLTGTVADLDKLSKTDEELLQKYSRVYFLNENYTPSDLDRIHDRYLLERIEEPQYFHDDAISFLEDLLDEADDDGIDLKVISAYRSFDEQTALKGQYSQVYGSGANTFSADQGYSEHQLGTTVDLTTPEINGTYESFAQTEAYAWLQENAYKYGFILSYPENNTHYVFEPWHWRFVGEDLAEYLHDEDIHFYNMDQREINEYLLNIFD